MSISAGLLSLGITLKDIDTTEEEIISQLKEAGESKIALSKCLKSECEWWKTVYSAGKIEHKGCAIKFIPMMNADGLMQV